MHVHQRFITLAIDWRPCIWMQALCPGVLKSLKGSVFRLFLSVLACCHFSVFAATPAAIVIDDHFTERAIGLDLVILEDPTAQLTLDDVRSVEYAKQFTPSTKQNPSFGYTKSAYWARFTLEDTRSPNRP